MSKIGEWIKKNKTMTSVIGIGAMIFVIGVVFAVVNSNSSYAIGPGATITFKTWSGEAVVASCRVDINGNLDDECLSKICSTCSGWYPNQYTTDYDNDGYNDGTSITYAQANQFLDPSFIARIEYPTYYCVGGTSSPSKACPTLTESCYVCDNDSSIMKWSGSNASDANCSSGYHKDTSINEANCHSIVNACYVCNDNPNIMKWDNNGTKDAKCSSGYTEDTSITEANCKDVYACYQCKDEDNKGIFKWSTNADPEGSCTTGFDKTNRTQADCGNVCYVCDSNSNIMKWSYDGQGDNKCSSYTKDTSITEANCKDVYACYQCKDEDNKNIFKWSTNADPEGSCTTGFDKTNRTQADCGNACYVCDSNSNIMKWSYDGQGDNKCSSYTKDTSITEANCKDVYACYQCNDEKNDNVFKWSTNDDPIEGTCDAGYVKTDKTQEECKSSACYVCREDDNVFDWKIDGTGNAKCEGGYDITTKTKEECKSSACYQCKTDEKVFRWGIDGEADNKCESGYDKTERDYDSCEFTPPPTGDALIVVAWVVGIAALCYSVYYFVIRKKKI